MTVSVLGVDDSDIILAILQAAFETAGFTFHAASDGVEGIKFVTALSPDIIITDIRMPRLDGIDFIKAIRRDTGNATLPILVHSSEQFSETYDRARQAGANGWLRKPCDTGTLVATVRQLVAS